MDSGRSGAGPLFWRALFAFLALPGMVAFVIPWVLAGPERGDSSVAGAIPFAAGVGLLLWCVREFYVAGRGTLAPWSPPRDLVITGPYRYSRNPMYVAVLLILLGWALAYRTRALWIYAAIVALAFELRIVFGEEPWLARTHGEQWTRYRERVSRWVGWR